jgi:hypothetical protein
MKKENVKPSRLKTEKPSSVAGIMKITKYSENPLHFGVAFVHLRGFY